MPVNNVTANRAYQLPDPTNQLDYDVGRIISAINGIDANVATLFASLSGKAATAHSHTIGDVTGLQAALDSKVGTGTNLPISQITNLQASLDAKANLAGADFTGPVTGVTPSLGANNTQFATTSWVRSQGFVTNGGGTWGISITGNATTATTATTAGNVSGTVAVANGGTGATTVAGARTSLGIDTDDNVTFGSVSDTAGNLRDVPPVYIDVDATLNASHAGRAVVVGTNTVINLTLPPDVFSPGDTIVVFRNSGQSMNILVGAGVYLVIAGTGTVGNRVLSGAALVTIYCFANNAFVISGAGVS